MQFQVVVIIWLAFSAITDFIIAAAMVVTLVSALFDKKKKDGGN
jgi:hypothetical protein